MKSSWLEQMVVTVKISKNILTINNDSILIKYQWFGSIHSNESIQIKNWISNSNKFSQKWIVLLKDQIMKIGSNRPSQVGTLTQHHRLRRAWKIIARIKLICTPLKPKIQILSIFLLFVVIINPEVGFIAF